jgi:hypothetical protein
MAATKSSPKSLTPATNVAAERILVLDFGSWPNHRPRASSIVRRSYGKHHACPDQRPADDPSGGPASVYAVEIGVPVLGISTACG